MATELLGIESMNTATNRNEGTATTVMRVGVKDLAQLAALLKRLGSVSNVISVRRSG